MRAQRAAVDQKLVCKGVDLLSYDGCRHDYAAVGRFLARSIHSKEERLEFCWFVQRNNLKHCARKLASAEMRNFSKVFLQLFLELFFLFKLFFFVSEAVKLICGDNLYALRRAKDAANSLGRHEKAEINKQNLC